MTSKESVETLWGNHSVVIKRVLYIWGNILGQPLPLFGGQGVQSTKEFYLMGDSFGRQFVRYTNILHYERERRVGVSQPKKTD